MFSSRPDGWVYESADPSVGIFDHGWFHDACPYGGAELGAYADVITASTTFQGEGANRKAVITVTLHCADCGQVATVVDEQWDPEDDDPEPHQ